MPKYASLVSPAPGIDRFTEIDALRGFALFGILLANLPFWVGVPFAPPEMRQQLMGGITLPAFSIFFNGILDGKFYTIFSLLFGLGFSLQLERLEARGAAGQAIFRRRMAVLLLFGLIHLSFIWSGDILTLYALLGFTLPLFRPLGDKALLAVAALFLFVVPVLGVWLLNIRNPEWLEPLWSGSMGLYAAAGGNPEADYFTELSTGGWRDLLNRAASEWAFTFTDKLETWRIPKVLGTMLVGMWAGRKLLRGELLDNRRLLWSVFAIGLVIALPLQFFYVQQPPHSQTHWSSLFGTAPAGFAYAAGFLLAIGHVPAIKRALSAVGRMALTNYFATSVVGGFIFFGLGLGMMGRIDLPQAYVGGLVLFALMIAFSRWWLAAHNQGPLEALWRRLTYPRSAASNSELAPG